MQLKLFLTPLINTRTTIFLISLHPLNLVRAPLLDYQVLVEFSAIFLVQFGLESCLLNFFRSRKCSMTQRNDLLESKR